MSTLPEPIPIRDTEVMSRLDAVVADAISGTVYLVQLSQPEGGAFVLGPAEVCGNVLGLQDEEYGWPTPVKLDEIKHIDDMRPGYRKHPVIVAPHGVCLSIGESEYREIAALVAAT